MCCRHRSKTRAIADVVVWATTMFFLWTPWSWVAVGHTGYWERHYGILGYYKIHHPSSGPVTSKMDFDMLACNSVLTLAFTVACLNDALKKPPGSTKGALIEAESSGGD
jgi:hypothetical protein